jgi:hypothetical protein
MMLYAEMDPAFVVSDQDKHLAAQHLYFWSYAFDGAGACTGTACLGMDKLLAKMSDAQLAAVMRSDYRWAQHGGQNTATPGDDAYQSTLQPGAPYTVTLLQSSALTPTVGTVVTVTATVTGSNGPTGDGILVTFDTSLGTISARSATSGDNALAHLNSNIAGTAHVTATTYGSGGPAQNTLTVTFTGSSLYLPLVLRSHN